MFRTEDGNHAALERAEDPGMIGYVVSDEIQEPPAGSTKRPAVMGPVVGGPVVAGVLLLLWFATAAWAGATVLGPLVPLDIVLYGAAACVPPILASVLWLIAMRTSRGEERRFADVARAMQREAGSLDSAVGRITTALDANRRHLAEQIEALTALGDRTGDRFTRLSHDIASDVAVADEHVQSLSKASGETQDRIDRLIAALPDARAEIDSAAGRMDEISQSAERRIAALEEQLTLLAEQGREADMTSGAAAERLATHVREMKATGATVALRLDHAVEQATGTIDALLARTADAIRDSADGLAAQGDAMVDIVRANQSALDGAARSSAEALSSRVAGVALTIDDVTTRLDAQREIGDRVVDELDRGLSQVQENLIALYEQGIDRSQMLAASISALGGSADAMTEALRTGETMATRTIGTTETLLIALDSAAREIDETLPHALDRLDVRIDQSKQVVVQAKPELLALVTAAGSTHDAIEAIAGLIAEQRETLDQLSGTLLDTLTTGRSRADSLGHTVDEAIERTQHFADDAAPRLIEALLRVRETANAAAERARETLANVIPEAAEAMERATAQAMRHATERSVERQILALAQATNAAVEGSTRAADTVSARVADIIEQTTLVETHIEQARGERDAAERTSLSRRVAVLVDALNSASIDITKAFSTDVPDSAWAAYLKGDRGVFTRRAVRIVEGSAARSIAELYDQDDGFRNNVHRYIHDFESMLRGILTQPEGSSISVTLLSSDMGKLYVALAQAIERLR